jgi:nitroreductase
MTPIPPETLLAALNWRYAVKKFDPTRRIPDATWAVLEQALVLTPSSIGLQPWQFIVVTDPAIKAQLRPAAYQQAQTEECSHLVVFAVHRDLGPAHVDRHIARMTEVHGTTPETHAKFRDMVVRNLDKARAAGTLDTWQTHQIYIALGNFMTAAAVIGVDTCPMEGIDPAKFDALLGLTGTSYATVVVCAAGYRLEADKYAVMKKVRFPAADVVKRV